MVTTSLALLLCWQSAILPTDATAVAGVARSARSIIQIDGGAARIVAGTLDSNIGASIEIPEAVRVASNNGESKTVAGIWTAVLPDEHGAFQPDAFAGGYLALHFDVPADGVMILEATGHSMVYANGPRMGDPYSTGYQRIPVALKKGRNELLFASGRGPIKAQLVEPRVLGAHLDTRDLTSPDLIVGEPLDSWIGMRVLNAAELPASGMALEIEAQDGTTTRTPVASLVGLGIAKAPARIRSGPFGITGPARFRVALVRADSPTGNPAGVLDEVNIELEIKPKDGMRKETFLSGIDGSAQYFALVPAVKAGADSPAAGIVLSLHGASVEATSQARCYKPRDWANIVAPTNRRPYGFDWEEWGRIDALEVLATARQRLNSDPLKQWLTGHSMGGHGTWAVGANHSDQFAAIAPSAGWISFFTYVHAPLSASDPSDRIGGILDRAANSSRPLLLKENYAQLGVYILHGDVDDNVPVTEAREMRSQLGSFHPDFAYHEQPGANHWWGDQCVDWPPLMDFLHARSLPAPDTHNNISFTTISPSIHSQSGWVTVDQQFICLEPSRVAVTLDRSERRVRGTTTNVARIGLDVDMDGDEGELSIEIDSTRLKAIEPDGGDLLWLSRATLSDGSPGEWSLCDPPDTRTKSAIRMGPFKSAFNNRALLVYGTAGTPAQTSALIVKARYDNEQFAYRGNASFEVIDDRTFLLHSADEYSNRNVILYGNSQTNGAWSAMVGDSPIQVRDGSIEVRASDSTSRTYSGDDLGAIFVRPRPNTAGSLVGVIAGTGLKGQSLLDRSPYFIAGTGFPDATIFRANMLQMGRTGIIGAAFFANDWTLSPADVLLWPISQ